MEEMVNLTIKLSGNTFQIRVDPNSTLEELKVLLELKISVPSENISLLLNGRLLQLEEATLKELNITDGSTLFLTVSRKDYVPTSIPLEQVGPTPEEKMMEQMMDNPIFNAMLNNPDTMKSMMESNPQLKKILDSNPELRHAMNNPSTMNEMMRTMRNPALRREMMRNTDRMMATIENMPGGFNELQKIYRNIQEPLEDAMENTDGGSAQPSTTRSNNNNNDPTANTTALPNPWATPSQTNSSPSSFMNMMGSGGLGGNGFPSMNDPMMQSMLNNPQLMNSILSSVSGAGLNDGGAQATTNSTPSLNPFLLNPLLMNPQMNPQMNLFGPNNTSINSSNTATNPSPQPSNLSQSNSSSAQSSIPQSSIPQSGNINSSTSISGEERFRIQITQLNEMGFTDTEKIISVLTQTKGDVESALEILFSDS